MREIAQGAGKTATCALGERGGCCCYCAVTPQRRPMQTSPFTETDLRAMHALFDPSGTGLITPAQVATAFRNLGLKASPPSSLPARVDPDAFVKAAQAAIAAEKVL